MEFCVIGRNIGYTLSPKLYEEMWKKKAEEGHTFGVEDLPALAPFIRQVKAGTSLRGFAVTSPYKEEIIPFLDALTADAEVMGAVNTVHITSDCRLLGHNTDIYGFVSTLPRFPEKGEKALVCGNGGASKAVQEGLQRLGIPFDLVSRQASPLSYPGVKTLAEYTHIVNATPVGSVKLPDCALPLPYDTAVAGTVFYDLNYAPRVTPFMREALERGCVAVDGLPLLTSMIQDSQWRFLLSGETL